eukprot:CAMPEP_0115279180 /NCGR_PEP_ID=MMETSP0270-20121206/58130_1 /TAXON_ID=71861 /ORGANISM="Scrippsiella trochoidea, Strain CCMP3099" /LENGTH=139 /DNA_ID=CAMNT_0002695859 /DNA_START=49 /DNA_END=466 /DNA_ORIENTATION=-
MSHPCHLRAQKAADMPKWLVGSSEEVSGSMNKANAIAASILHPPLKSEIRDPSSRGRIPDPTRCRARACEPFLHSVAPAILRKLPAERGELQRRCLDRRRVLLRCDPHFELVMPALQLALARVHCQCWWLPGRPMHHAW